MVRPRSRPRQKPVKVSRSGSYLEHDVGEESELFAALTKPVLDPRISERGELVFNEVQQPLIEPGDPFAPHTMLHQVKQLKPNGVPVLCQASNVVAGPFCRDDEDLSGYSARQQPLVRLWSQARGPSHGQIVAVDQGGMLDLLLALIDHVDALRFAVVVHREADAAPLRSYLEKRLLSNTWSECEQGPHYSRVYVGTANDIMRQRGNGPVHGLVYWGTAAALSERGKLLQEYAFAAMPGGLIPCYLIRRAQPLSPEARAEIARIAGPVIYTETDRLGTRRMHYVQLHQACHQRPGPRVHQSSYDWKLHSIWNNRPRNQQVWSIVQAWQAVNWTGHVAEAFGVNRTVLEPCPPNIVVLVESVEHAEALRRLRPEWQIRNMCLTCHQGADRPVTRWWPCSDQEIVTMKAAAGYGIAADVVIRADGSCTPWTDRWLRPTGTDGFGLTPTWVVDLDDSGSVWGDRFTSARLRRYGSHQDIRWFTHDRRVNGSSRED